MICLKMLKKKRAVNLYVLLNAHRCLLSSGLNVNMYKDLIVYTSINNLSFINITKSFYSNNTKKYIKYLNNINPNKCENNKRSISQIFLNNKNISINHNETNVRKFKLRMLSSKNQIAKKNGQTIEKNNYWNIFNINKIFKDRFEKKNE